MLLDLDVIAVQHRRSDRAPRLFVCCCVLAVWHVVRLGGMKTILHSHAAEVGDAQ